MRYTAYGNEQIKINNKEFVYDDINPEVVFSFGGDGTMLRAIHKYIDKIDNVKFLGIKTGNLGFYTTFEISELNEALKLLFNNKLVCNKLNLLEYQINDNISGLALNEIAITNPIHTQIFDIYINNYCLETFRGTGLLVSPPSGSTAYNKSLGGSVIEPCIKAFQLTEIASINNRVYHSLNSPLLLGENTVVSLKPHDNNNIYLMEVCNENYRQNSLSINNNRCYKLGTNRIIQI